MSIGEQSLASSLNYTPTMEETTYDTFTTPVVAPNITQLPQEHLAYVRAQGYNEAVHEPLERYASEDIDNGYSTWIAIRRTDSDESEESEEGDLPEEEQEDGVHWEAYADFLHLLEDQAAEASPLDGTAVPLTEGERVDSK
ncbi:hypothetical protein M409DRAFT_27054 [Zasmidium cellare ATCC 36951]|uniref:Uncharacterized protein n=1 Tax=Zasmidium cellare ATCC 36951 TaxID=1080233 RepID=A0A6A6C9V0_ZASCE|nr:uncharacterized protein M409DRAFT_27054 [Zasmidium cellare ATCC 36951]KAF2162429.1 hypothetical protein M409DRAFT_27054 [Zasmidium cellare ATCC 36951]